MLRRWFGLRVPTTSHEALQNLIRAGWWEIGLLAIAVVVAIVTKTAFPSSPSWVWAIVFIVIIVPPGAATVAVAREGVAMIRFRLRERKATPRTGNILIDHDMLVVAIVVAGVFALSFYLVLSHRI
jgi:hypothetical protein